MHKNPILREKVDGERHIPHPYLDSMSKSDGSLRYLEWREDRGTPKILVKMCISVPLF